jgi:SWI/SNF-related matrix-associated actin-dependent regulator of chromatin subfamily A3
MAKQSSAKGKRKQFDIDLTVSSDDEPQQDGKHSVKAARRSKDDAPSSNRATGIPTPPSSHRNDSHDLPGSSISQQHSEAKRQDWLADDSADVNELVASSQQVAGGSDQWQHYGDFPTKIVGVSFYKGHANPNEHVLLRREPGNPYVRSVQSNFRSVLPY